MKSYRIKSSQSVTLTLLSGGKGESEPALSPYGPVRAGLTTLPGHSMPKENLDQVLSVLLSTLEREVEILLRKSCEALDTFLTGSTHLVEPMTSREEITITNVIE